ncbi:GGDEF domain-containing protein [Mangrovihabitans endophyticus]|uniref:GGDEF domain-containing protein n=1 Tax=Mangrovihabitans endophyticus TaxID=1751298 RepID=A0A8J3BWX6_9ACTN|nr:GGDEF domain-containing protein [Mangrovihabitans endophyticus]GGK77328.1 hypothetical protein GCM10012284_09180 [Mangrovihabitans endophyticus]
MATDIARTPAGSRSPHVTALLDQAEEARLAGDYRRGHELAGQAEKLAASVGDLAGRAGALRSMADQLLRLGEQEAAVGACRAAAVLLAEIGDDPATCRVLTVLAMPLNELGMHEEALQALADAREIAQRLGDRDLLYWVHNRTGVVHGSMGDRELSTRYLMTALGMADGMDDEARFCILNNVGDNGTHRVPQLRADGDTGAAHQVLTQALQCVTEALGLARAARHPFRESICLDNYGMLLALTGDYAEAERLIEDSRAIAVIHGYRSLESAALQHQARVRLMRGQVTRAIEGLLAALDRAVEAGEVPMEMEIHRELSEAYEQTGDCGAALRHYRAHHRLERRTHNEVAAARARMAVHHFELDNARLETANARLEAELHRVRSVELEEDRRQLAQQAREDPLTGLPNRRCAQLRLPELAAGGGPMCVAIADADFFKDVNDRFGHPVGDVVLRRLAALLRDTVGEPHLVARFGGEEFLIALHGLDPDAAAQRCELIRSTVAAWPWHTVQPGLAVTISVGLAMLGEGSAETALTDALRRADEQLYRAKREGRNRVSAGLPEAA